MTFRNWITRMADALFPTVPSCIGCQIEKGVTDGLCAKCRAELKPLRLGETTAKDLTGYSLYKYEGFSKRLIRAYKYGGKRYLSQFMAFEIAQALQHNKSDITAICHVPLHPKRKGQRGFDQAELIAQHVSALTGIPFINAARRIKNTKTQTRLNEKQRMENMQGAFESVVTVFGGIILIDDVLTTGATAAECAKALKTAGADSVYVYTFARSMFGNKKEKYRSRLWFSPR